jgi:hypothetical protein
METVIDTIQERFSHLGWSMTAKVLDTSVGDRLWVVFGRRNKQSFSAYGPTQTAAWESAWHLARQLHLVDQMQEDEVPEPNILSFRRFRDERVA